MVRIKKLNLPSILDLRHLRQNQLGAFFVAHDHACDLIRQFKLFFENQLDGLGQKLITVDAKRVGAAAAKIEQFKFVLGAYGRGLTYLVIFRE